MHKWPVIPAGGNKMNVVVETGRLVADPELRHTTSDIAVTGIRIAVNRPWRKGQEQKADFLDVTAWRGTAEFICRNFSKGDMIEVHGALRVADDYTDHDGNKRYGRPYILANDVGFCGSKSNAKKDTTSPSPQSVSGDTGDFQALPADDDLPF